MQELNVFSFFLFFLNYFNHKRLCFWIFTFFYLDFMRWFKRNVYFCCVIWCIKLIVGRKSGPKIGLQEIKKREGKQLFEWMESSNKPDNTHNFHIYKRIIQMLCFERSFWIFSFLIYFLFPHIDLSQPCVYIFINYFIRILWLIFDGEKRMAHCNSQHKWVKNMCTAKEGKWHNSSIFFRLSFPIVNVEENVWRAPQKAKPNKAAKLSSYKKEWPWWNVLSMMIQIGNNHRILQPIAIFFFDVKMKVQIHFWNIYDEIVEIQIEPQINLKFRNGPVSPECK